MDVNGEIIRYGATKNFAMFGSIKRIERKGALNSTFRDRINTFYLENIERFCFFSSFLIGITQLAENFLTHVFHQFRTFSNFKPLTSCFGICVAAGALQTVRTTPWNVQLFTAARHCCRYKQTIRNEKRSLGYDRQLNWIASIRLRREMNVNATSAKHKN
jgi:hypothetical protein